MLLKTKLPEHIFNKKDMLENLHDAGENEDRKERRRSRAAIAVVAAGIGAVAGMLVILDRAVDDSYFIHKAEHVAETVADTIHDAYTDVVDWARQQTAP
jgi:hypothetical protein